MVRPVDAVTDRIALPSVGDAVAGISVAIVLVPQALAYAQLAGMPAYRGLYAAALPPIAAALFASSPYLQTGPVALTSLLTFGALSSLASIGSPRYVGLGALLALVVGAARLLVGVFRAGVVAYLISQPMLLGFMPAAAIVIVATQLPTLLGAGHAGGRHILADAWNALVHPQLWSAETIALGVIAIAFVVGGRRVHRLFPSVLLLVVGATAFSRVSSYHGRAVGKIPGGIEDATFHLPWSELPHLLLPGAVIALVGFVEPSSIARTFAAQERTRWDANREFVGQGVGNLTSFLVGGFPIGGSFSRSALNRLAGATTTWSGLIAALAVVAFLPFASVLRGLPNAVLAGIVIASVIGQLRLFPLLRLGRLSRPQLVVALTTFALTIALAPHVEWGIVAGIGLAVALHLYRELQLEIVSEVHGSTLELTQQGVLWFGTAPRLEEEFLSALSQHHGIDRLVVHLDSLGRVDLTGALALRGLLARAREAGIETQIVDVRPRWHGLVENVIARDRDPLLPERRLP